MSKFVGVYALNTMPDFKVTVTLENGALFAQATGQGKAPVFPESETKVFFRIVDAQLEFTSDADGAITGLVLHQMSAKQPFTRTSQAPQ